MTATRGRRVGATTVLVLALLLSTGWPTGGSHDAAELRTDALAEEQATAPSTASSIAEPAAAADLVVAPYAAEDAPVCADAPLDCLDRLIAEMARHVEELGCDHNAVFALLYLRTTEAIRDAISGGGRYFVRPHFADADFLAGETYLFGRYYLDAFAAWQRGDDAQVPGAWRAAFEAARDERVMGLGNVLLGISAHVNRDLPYVLASLGLRSEDGGSRRADHEAVDEVLARVTHDVRREVGERYDPMVDPTAAHDPNLVPRWRAAAWHRAGDLVEASTGGLEDVAAALEAEAVETVEGFATLTAYPEHAREQLVAERDAHCEANRRAA